MGFSNNSWNHFLDPPESQEKPILTRSLLKRVWHFTQPYRWQVLGLLFTIVLTSIVSLLQPLLFRDLIDNVIPQADITRLNWLAVSMVGIPLIGGAISIWQRHLSASIGEGITYDLRRELYTHLQRMSLRFFTQKRTGELISRLNNDVIGAQHAINDTLANIIASGISILMTITIMLFFEWRLTLLALAMLPLFMIIIHRVEQTLRRLSRQLLARQAEMNVTINETMNVSGALLVKLFGQEVRAFEQFSNDADAVRKIGVQSAVVGSWLFVILSLVTTVGTVFIYWIGGYFALQGTFTVGTIVAFSVYLAQLYGPLITLANAPIEFSQSLVSFERVFEVLDTPAEITNLPSALTLPPVKGQIRFEDVSFRYTSGIISHLQDTAGVRRNILETFQSLNNDTKNGTKPMHEWALYHVSFTIGPGQLAALVGPSGAGKTTTTYLIPRLYDPTEGRILIDGTDIRSVALKSLTNSIGMVTQETFLFYDTIRANLLYAHPEATEAEMIEAAKAANVHELIMSLPDKYDTYVGERGYRLSGGERQRLAIARVILKDPRILILDEATSNLDSLSEALIQEALQRLMKNRTSLVIAHRLSTILSADVILVMENGCLIEQGTHQELLAKEGLYSTLYETQFTPLMSTVS